MALKSDYLGVGIFHASVQSASARKPKSPACGGLIDRWIERPPINRLL
jgi:hypothetical protein